MAGVRANGRRITPFLSFNERNAEEAVEFYLSVFPGSKRLGGARTPLGFPQVGEAGSLLTIEFEILGERFVALNGGPPASFNEAISFVVYCDTQEEIDHLWEKLPAGGGRTIQCGWLKDRFGVAWQIVPAKIFDWIHDRDVAARVLPEVWGMTKLDLARLEHAARG